MAAWTPTTLVLIGWAFVATFMLVLWLIQRATRDAGIVDFGWAASLGLLAVFYGYSLDGSMPRRAVVASLAAIWSFRLAWFLLVDRIIGKEEDGRYQQLRKSWAPHLQLAFLGFFQAQGILDVLLSLSFLVAMLNPEPNWVWSDWAAVAVWVLSVAGESTADGQLRRFRSNPQNRGQVCQLGLWRYSRHPNYFFEWLHWWSYVLFAIGSPLFWLSFGAPVLMLFLILKVTGIPPTEARALESRGEAYRRYQRTTSAFVPWFPKDDSA